ncbi:hypothetical protein Tco_1351089 [Tanacetum coccineum]
METCSSTVPAVVKCRDLMTMGYESKAPVLYIDVPRRAKSVAIHKVNLYQKVNGIKHKSQHKLDHKARRTLMLSVPNDIYMMVDIHDG